MHPIRVNNQDIVQNLQVNSTSCNKWQNISFNFNSGSATTVLIEIFDDDLFRDANDFALDDIYFSRCRVRYDDVIVSVGAPQISTSSYFYWDVNHPIVPNSHNYFCTKWENNRFSHFISSVTSGNTWYINDVAIASGGGTYFGLNVSINNNMELIINGPDNSLNELKVQVQRCGLLSQATYIQVTPIPIGDANGAEFLGNYKQSYTATYGNGIYSLGFGTRYAWSIPGVTFSQASSLSPTISITFPANVTTPTLNATLTVTNAPHCNGSYPYYLQYNPNITTPIRNDLKIFPNPAINEILISNVDAGSYNLELLDNTGSVIKKVKLTNGQSQVKVNISSLYSGVYFCNIYSSKGIQRKQFIVSIR
ncbi:MAG TPA: T9SS type A sorting domain-containing protein [Chitinophagaceae bacterium]|nr:T9SS type A sorting domain-containing protein [Chitinophagaceae bacterium]